MTAADLARWREDPCAWVEDVLVNPEDGCPFVLYGAQKRFLREGFTLTSRGTLPYPELVFGACKKSGKTALAAMALLYVTTVLGGRYAEAYVLANDLEQSQARVFLAAARMVEAAPLLKAKVTGSRIEFASTGATITALASDYASAAGANPTITVLDELWAYTSERSRRLFDEMVPPPTRKVATRLTVTYAGFEGESELLEDLYKRGLKGKRVATDLYAQRGGILLYWTHAARAPWQTKTWLTQMRGQLRPNAYLRLIENRWVTSETSFVEPEWWDACEDTELRPVVSDHYLPVWVGIDASTKRDTTAVVACTWDGMAQKVRLVWHRIFQPTAKEPLHFEQTVEKTVLELRDRFAVRAVIFDPFAMQSSAQRLTVAGVKMVERPQSVPNITEASTCLYELVKAGNLAVYPDDALRLAVQRAVAIETTRGWKIAKAKASHKVDVVIALAMAALGAVQEGNAEGAGIVVAANLSPQAVRSRVGGNEADPENWAAGYERELREQARAEFLADVPYDSDLLGSRRWRDDW